MHYCDLPRQPMWIFHNLKPLLASYTNQDDFISRMVKAGELIRLKSKHLEAKDLLIDLIEARRMDEDNLRQLNKRHLCDISENYRSKAVRNLVNVVGML